MKSETCLIGLDVGTTHTKAGLFSEREGRLELDSVCSRPSPVKQASQGYAFYDPQELWEVSAACIREVLEQAGHPQVLAVGIASMAESGLLVERHSGEPRSPILPWFDQAATSQADRLGYQGDPAQRKRRFLISGIYPTFKCSLGKMLWWRELLEIDLGGLVWLPVASYITYHLTGKMGCDPSLAGRTYAYDINRMKWDNEWLGEWGLGEENFPSVLPAGVNVGGCLAGNTAGLPPGTAVSVAGHDHVCAALAAGAVVPGQAFDSMGTAESLLGAYQAEALGEAEYASGLSYGCHVLPGLKYWMGGLSASGGSLEWLRDLLGEPRLSYADLENLAQQAGEIPGDVLYFPYLSGSGSPHSDPLARGGFIGLKATHTRAHLVKAVLEGTAYELEFVRQAAERATITPIQHILAAGGGTRNRRWMQVKADVSGCTLEVLRLPEAVTLGAALLGGIGCGRYACVEEALAARPEVSGERYPADVENHGRYKEIYQNGYIPLQEPLRELSRQIQRLAENEI